MQTLDGHHESNSFHQSTQSTTILRKKSCFLSLADGINSVVEQFLAIGPRGSQSHLQGRFCTPITNILRTIELMMLSTSFKESYEMKVGFLADTDMVTWFYRCM